eukprot:2346997-Pleurochrysis_carterae.AAC.2
MVRSALNRRETQGRHQGNETRYEYEHASPRGPAKPPSVAVPERPLRAARRARARLSTERRAAWRLKLTAVRTCADAPARLWSRRRRRRLRAAQTGPDSRRVHA